MRLLAFGLGYSARAAMRRLRPRLAGAWGTTRDSARFAQIEEEGARPLLFDGAMTEPLASAIAGADHLLLSVAPDRDGDPVLRACRDALAAAPLRSIVYLSTVGVYGDHDGAWVDEESECRPVSARSLQRLAAEDAWRAFASEANVPLAIIRLAGIYGPCRGPFEKIRHGTARRIVKPGQVFNRIHADDIAAIVDAAFARRAHGIFNGTDDEPAPPEEVLDHAAGLLGLPSPPLVPFGEAEMTAMARSFYGENKRVRNDRIKRELGVTLAYPTYREGLRATLAAEAALTPAA